jgi:hypothetical protein
MEIRSQSRINFVFAVFQNSGVVTFFFGNTTDILYYRQTVSSVRSSGPPERERSHKRREAIELKMNFRIWTTLLYMIWVEL